MTFKFCGKEYEVVECYIETIEHVFGKCKYKEKYYYFLAKNFISLFKLCYYI